jgi:hypothetical protein
MEGGALMSEMVRYGILPNPYTPGVLVDFYGNPITGAGGSITLIESTDGTVTVTNGSGPTVDLSVTPGGVSNSPMAVLNPYNNSTVIGQDMPILSAPFFHTVDESWGQTVQQEAVCPPIAWSAGEYLLKWKMVDTTNDYTGTVQLIVGFEITNEAGTEALEVGESSASFGPATSGGSMPEGSNVDSVGTDLVIDSTGVKTTAGGTYSVRMIVLANWADCTPI